MARVEALISELATRVIGESKATAQQLPGGIPTPDSSNIDIPSGRTQAEIEVRLRNL